MVPNATPEEFARRLVACFPDIITAVDRNGNYTFISERIEGIIGYKPEDLVGRRFGLNVAKEDLPRLQDVFQELITGRQSSATLEYQALHKDGTPRTAMTTACPLTNAAGEIVGVVASTRDITEHRRLEQQIVQTEKLAAIGRMIASVSHELNNPLTVILGASEVAQLRPLDASTRRQFEVIHQQARRTAELVQSLLTFSRPVSAVHRLLDLNELVREALQPPDHGLRVNNIVVDVVTAKDLPPVKGDSGQLLQVLVNLIANAEQAIHEVRERGTIRIRSGASEDKVWVSVQDDGPGIAEHILPNIFDPFFTTKPPGRGTGLGLSICLSIIHEHGGTIKAEAAPGGGAIFTMTLPAARRIQF